jgi:hypothetical protein
LIDKEIPSFEEKHVMVINKKEKHRKSNQHKFFQEIRVAQNPPDIRAAASLGNPLV